MTETINLIEEQWYYLPENALLDVSELESCWLSLPISSVEKYYTQIYQRFAKSCPNPISQFFFKKLKASTLLIKEYWQKGHIECLANLEFLADNPDFLKDYCPPELTENSLLGVNLHGEAGKNLHASETKLLSRKPFGSLKHTEVYYLLEPQDVVCLDEGQDISWINYETFTLDFLYQSFKEKLPNYYPANEKESLFDLLKGCMSCRVLLPNSTWISGKVRLNFRMIFVQTSSEFTLLSTETPNLTDSSLADPVNTETPPNSLDELRKLADDL